MTNIVMITRDRYTLLCQSLQSLYANTPQSDFNLTLVDDGSTDFRALRSLEAVALYSNCILVRVDNSGHVLSQLKNLGVEAAAQFWGQGEYLYLSDNDVYFMPGWLGTLTTAYERGYPNGFRLIGGQVHPYHKPSPASQLPLEPERSQDLEEYDSLDGPSWFMDWSVWRGLGPLSRTTKPGPCQSEDCLFCNRVRAAGYRIGAVKPHVVIHTGLYQTNGNPAPGMEIRLNSRMPGVIYE